MLSCTDVDRIVTLRQTMWGKIGRQIDDQWLLCRRK